MTRPMMGKRKTLITVSKLDGYWLYKRKGGTLSKSEYLAVLDDYLVWASDQIAAGFTIKLPHLGTIKVIGTYRPPDIKNMDRAIINWRGTKKLHEECPECKRRGQKLYHLNEHSDYVLYSIKWTRPANCLMCRMYKSTATSDLRTKVHKAIMAGKQY